jgi:hypothetical protein
MKKFIATFAAVAAIGLGSAAMAQNAMSGDAMHGDAMHGDAMHSAMTMPTAVCRAAMKGETANTHMGSDDLMCKKFDLAKAKATFEKMMMALPGQPTQADVDAAWEKAFGNANLIGQHPG